MAYQDILLDCESMEVRKGGPLGMWVTLRGVRPTSLADAIDESHHETVLNAIGRTACAEHFGFEEGGAK